MVIRMFQSTRLCEARPSKTAVFNVAACFNPRACVRRDSLDSSDQNLLFSFNPRACVRRDCFTYAVAIGLLVSIHAPV